MTAGGESTKVQLTTGGKAVSSNHHPRASRDRAEWRPTALIAQWGPCVACHPLDISLTVQKFQTAAMSPNIGACLRSFPTLLNEGLVFSCAGWLSGRPQPAPPAAECVSGPPSPSILLILSQSEDIPILSKNQYAPQHCCLSRAAWGFRRTATEWAHPSQGSHPVRQAFAFTEQLLRPTGEAGHKLGCLKYPSLWIF
jgi:hypothetical protein